MIFPFRSNRRRVSSRPRQMGGRQVTTRSGRVLKVNTSMSGRWAEHREAKARRKVERMRGLPKSRVKRLFWRLNPKRQAEFWFSRDGAIMALKVIGVVIFLFFVLTIGVFAFYRGKLKYITDLSNQNLSGSWVFYDRTGKNYLGQLYGTQKRVPVQSDQISHWIKDATIAVEDRDFYKHRGFDVKGIVRAGLNDIFHHGGVQGGSTITEQLVKLAEGWDQKRNLVTKINEIILAVELERTQTKDEILREYLNLAPYGGLDYGVQVAAQDYFHVNASQLNIPQAAMLAAIPKSPSRLSPYNSLLFDKKAFIDRYRYVLDSMAQTGKISQAQADRYKGFNILATVHKQPSAFSGIIAPYFILAAKNQLEAQFDTNGPNQQSTGSGNSSQQAWKIITTLDVKIQKLAEDKVRANIPNIHAHLADTAATVVEDVQSGQYLAEVGGLDFNNKEFGQINYAQRQLSPGSSFKPYDYSTLIQNHTDAGAGSVLYDVTSAIPGYSCTDHRLPPLGNCPWDFDRRSPGPETLRYALGGSRNIPAIKAMAEAVQGGSVRQSIDKVIDTAQRLMNNDAQYACYKSGADVNKQDKADQMPCYTSAAIGDGAYLHLDHHLNGLSSLGRLGLSIPATYVLKISDANNNTVWQWRQLHQPGDSLSGLGSAAQVVDKQTAYIVNNMLSDPNASYFAYGTKFQSWNGWRIAVKTGTTNNAFDGLMMAYTTKYAVGSWVGWHTRNQPILGPMENITMPMTRDIIEGALSMSGGKPNNWPEPSGIQHLPAYVIRSHLAYGSVEPSPSTEIYPSWYKQPGTSGSGATIDRVSGKLATKCTPPAARQSQAANVAANHFSIDIFYGNHVSTTGQVSGSDDVHNCSDSPPTVQLTISGGSFGKYTISGTGFAGTHPLNDPKYPQFPGTITLSVGGVTKSCTGVTEGTPCTMTYRPSSTGSQRVVATITDSVLYQGSDSANHYFTSANASPLKFGAATKTGGTTTISWSGGSPSYTVTDDSKGGVTICSTSSTSCPSNVPSKNDQITVTDSKGNSVSGPVQ